MSSDAIEKGKRMDIFMKEKKINNILMNTLKINSNRTCP